MRLKTCIIVLLLLVSQSIMAQVEFTAKVSKQRLGVNERLNIDFVMNQEGDNFSPPSFKGFELIGGPRQSVSHSWINGKQSFSRTYTYTLSPKRRGKVRIGSASVEVEGKVYKTVPVTVEITAAVDRPRDANDPGYIADENLHLVASISENSPYLNEGITIEYRLYVSPFIRVSNFDLVDSPKYSDFWSQNIDVKQYRLQSGTYKGKDYRYVVLRRVVLYPQKTGELRIEPLTLDVTVEVPTNRVDFFGDRIYQAVHKKVAAGSRKINVKPLPENGKPASFNGAVGAFEFDVTTNKKALKAGESLEATVKISGTGNLRLFTLPELVVPSSLEVYEPEHKENVRTTLSGMKGSVSNTYTIVPQYKGNYPISRLDFSYFNPETESYQTVSSIEHIVEVLSGPVNTNATAGTTTNKTAQQQHVVSGKNQFRSFHVSPNLQPIVVSQFFRSKLFWGLLLLPILVVPVLIVVRRKKLKLASDVQGSKIRKADKLAKKFLSEAKKNLNNKDLFYESLHKSLHNYLKAKLLVETAELSKDKIRTLFSERDILDEVTSSFLALIENCELARFTPISSDTMQQDYNSAVQVISAIDKSL